MKPRVVFDTNVLISAIVWKGKPKKLLGLAKESKIELITSNDILKELSGVLFREKKFELSEQLILDTVEDILEFSYIVIPTIKINFPRDPKDSKILECAITCNADYIISGDDDLLKLREFFGIKIIKVADASDIFPL